MRKACENTLNFSISRCVPEVGRLRPDDVQHDFSHLGPSKTSGCVANVIPRSAHRCQQVLLCMHAATATEPLLHLLRALCAVFRREALLQPRPHRLKGVRIRIARPGGHLHMLQVYTQVSVCWRQLPMHGWHMCAACITAAKALYVSGYLATGDGFDGTRQPLTAQGSPQFR